MRFAPALIGLFLIACTQTPAAPGAGLAFELTGRCRGRLTLEQAPAKLTPVPARLETQDCEITAAEIGVDMPGMPMHVAPVALTGTGNTRRGEIVFTMSGPWVIELRLTHKDGQRETSTYDLRIP